MPLPIYQPKVKLAPIYVPREGAKPCLKYNHDVDIAKFKGRFIASWNANEAGAEDVPGQYNFLSVSDDFESWTSPVKLFSSEAGCENPVDSDNQWQPSFINFKDETLFSAWCDFVERKTFVASSSDGVHWRNLEIPCAPKELEGAVVGFPTNHGLLLRNGAMAFPCSLPFAEAQNGERNGRENGRCVVGQTRYAAMILSFDGGKSWEWSKPVEAVNWTDLGEKEDLPGGNSITIWEPGIYEEPSGRVGMLIRNVSSQDTPARDPFMKPHHMILHSFSDDSGRTWSKARPIEVDSIISRIYPEAGAGTPDSLMMVMNDWIVNVPRRISHDRFFLSLYCAPVCDPDLLLPGPLVQPEGGGAFYPNGFVDGSSMFVAYTYPNSIMCAKVETLPDFSKPFLLPRAGRSGLRLEDGIAHLRQRWSGLGLVLTKELTEKPSLKLSFKFRIACRREGSFTLLTLGGKTRAGAKLLCVYDKASGKDILAIESVSGEKQELGETPQRKWLEIKLEIGQDSFSACFGGRKVFFKGSLLRKISFGGLYEMPEWPLGCVQAEDIEIDLNSIIVG